MVTSWQVTPATPAARAVLDAAGRLFYERGINVVGVETLAAEAGVTKKTLYDRFGSKSALVAAYLTGRDHHFRGWVERSIGTHSGVDRPLAVFDALDSWMDAHSPNGCAFVHAYGELLGSPDHPAHDVIREEKRWLRQRFTELLRELGAHSPPELAMQLVVLLEGAKVVRSITEEPGAIAQARRAARVLLLEGLGEM